MPFDFKKEYKEFYMPKSCPALVTVPEAHYIAVRGQGDPNAPDGEYSRAVSVLYSVAYTLRMSSKAGHAIEGFFDYVVPPLEGFWWMEGTDGMDYGRKADFRWIAVIRLPDFITPEELEWAKAEATRKKGTDCSGAEFYTVTEGVCVQMLHEGTFDDEPASVARMDAFLQENGYDNDFSDGRLHHEIYLSDARRVPPEKWRTVLRHPVRKTGD